MEFIGLDPSVNWDRLNRLSGSKTSAPRSSAGRPYYQSSCCNYGFLSVQPAYGYEITARLREQGFSDIAEGTVYALLVRIEQRGLVDVEKVPSEKGPPRKVYSLNAQGQAYLEEFWRTWSFLTERIGQLHRDHTG